MCKNKCLMLSVQSVCSRMNPIFATSQHQDSQELLTYLMTGLNEGLNKVRASFDCQTMMGFFLVRKCERW